MFSAIVIDALEEIGLANTIQEGRKGEFVSEDEIKAILTGKA